MLLIRFVFDLVDGGVAAGASYKLLQFDSLVGFTASDFTFAGAGAAGSFSIANGAVGFTAAVPEPRLSLIHISEPTRPY